MSDDPVAVRSATNSSECPAWELLPAPPVAPLTIAAQYQPPAQGSMDPQTLLLSSWRTVLIAMVMTAGLVFAVLGVLVNRHAMDVAKTVPMLVILLLLCGLFWLAVAFPPRLTLDAEGLRWKPLGPRRAETSILWADIAALRLEGRLTRLGNSLRLRVLLRYEDGSQHVRPRGALYQILPVGLVGFDRVDQAVRRYARCDYSSSRW